MARRNRNRQDQLGNLLVHVQRRFANTPLKAVGDMLVNIISDVQRSVQAGFSSSEDAERIAAYVARVFEFLPSSFGDRFTFDGSLSTPWRLSIHRGMPVSRECWCQNHREHGEHQTVSMPSSDGQDCVCR